MLYFDRQIDDVRVAVWHLTENYEELLSMLPDADDVQTEAEDRFSSEKRILEWTAVRVLLYTILDRQVHISYDEQGAPLLPDYEGLDISISHTKGYVAIALSESSYVGVDVEQIEDVEEGEMSRVEKVRSRFVANDEYAESVIGLLLHWSAKESAFKLLGRENVDFLEDLKITPFDETNYEGQFNLTDTKEDDTYLVWYKVFDDFVLTLTNQKI